MCLASKAKEVLIKHHVSYFPERVAYVHYECHKIIHSTDNHFLIQYSPEDSKRFYSLSQNKNDSSRTLSIGQRIKEKL